MIFEDHPRYESLLRREKIINAYKKGILADAGMIAHGRGEAFDYLIGEKTSENAFRAIEAASAALILADNPVISVNGNAAALVSEDLVKLSSIGEAKLEINLFYRTPQRVDAILKKLKKAGAEEVLGAEDKNLEPIDGLKSPRKNVSPEGMLNADVILVPLEDGDRTEALVSKGKLVIAVDLNPLSRTSRTATITIVDNITRVMPHLIRKVNELKEIDRETLKKIVDGFSNRDNLTESLKIILNSIKDLDELANI